MSPHPYRQISSAMLITPRRPYKNSCCRRWYSSGPEAIPIPVIAIATVGSLNVVSREDFSSSTMVWNTSDTSTVVKTLAFVSKGSFSSMVGIVYLGLLIALLWSGLGQYRCEVCLFGFSLTSILYSQSVGWVTGLIIPSSESLFSSSFTRSNFATGTRRVGACTGVIEGSCSICIGVPRGFPAPV